MPFGGSVSPERRLHYDTVYEYIIKKPIEEAGFDCERGDEIPDYGPIPEQITRMLGAADLVVADLSGRNANVFYELGYRHALDKPTISIADNIEGLPFNVAARRTIRYRLDDITVAASCIDTIKRYAMEVRGRLDNEPQSGAAENADLPFSGLEAKLSTGLTNVYQLIGELSSAISDTAVNDNMKRLVERFDEQLEQLRRSESFLSGLGRGTRFTATSELMSIYPNRAEAIENEFYRAMTHENSGIGIVGSTISGLRGHKSIEPENVIELLQDKARESGFTLRILLTHWDFISMRQDQEKTDKNFVRYVISKELRQAVEKLRNAGLEKHVKFYKGAPTCHTIFCEEQKLMLVNPYPYEREAFNSWTLILRGDFEGIYATFKSAHLNGPWNNRQLAVPMDADCDDVILRRYHEDMERAVDDMKKELEGQDEKLI